MSIYATIGELAIRQFGDEDYTGFYIQGVPAHIDYTGPEWEFLPPPVDPESDGYRAVLIIREGTSKGTDRCGQEYTDSLVTLTGQEWEQIRFVDLIERIEAALDARREEPRPDMVFLGPDGVMRRIFHTPDGPRIEPPLSSEST